MALTDQDIAPDVPQAPPQGDPQPAPAEQYYNYLKKAGADVPPTFDSFKNTLSDEKSARQYYGYLRQNKFDAPDTYDSFARTLGIANTTIPAEHEIRHTSIQDLRHLNDLANQPIHSRSVVIDPMSGSSSTEWDQQDIARNKAAKDQYENSVGEYAKNLGVTKEGALKALQDFPSVNDDQILKTNAYLADKNPVAYARKKDNYDIMQAMATSGPDGVHDANIFNSLQTASSFEEMEHNIAAQQELLAKHGLGQQYFEKLKRSQAPLFNIMQPGLLQQYWNSDDHKMGLSELQYAGLEYEKIFSPDLYKTHIDMIRENKGLDQGGNPTEQGQAKKGYAYQRGVENTLYQLELIGRQNSQAYASQLKGELGDRVDFLTNNYRALVQSSNNKDEQDRLIDEYNNHPDIKEAGRVDELQQAIDYSKAEDYRRFPLNYNDKNTRLVKDAQSSTDGFWGAAGKDVNEVLLSAGRQSDNTARFIKNTFINLVGSDHAKAVNNAENIGHAALSDLSMYEGSDYELNEPDLVIPDDLKKKTQDILNDSSLSSGDRMQKAVNFIKENSDQITSNVKEGQRNITGKSIMFAASNTLGQILGIADQSLLMGNVLGNATKGAQLVNNFVPMYASTQNQLYEEALKNGEEHPLLRSSLDATVLSLASLINPDIKVVKGMIGAETGVGKMIAGIDEATWNKILSENKPLLDRMAAATKASAKQFGLAQLQYGLIAPTAQYLVHKNILNENPNLGDMITDGMLQTSLTMALPAITHGIWGFAKATDVNPMQKYALVEAGLHPKERTELIEDQIQRGQITPEKGGQLKEAIKQAGDILRNVEMNKTDGSPMNEQEVADVLYNMMRKKALEGKLKNAAEPQKPIIEQRLHEINQEIAEQHTSEADQQKTELNKMLNDNLSKIIDKMPMLEGPIKDAIKRNEPEEIFKMIHDQATETTNVGGKEISSRPLTEETFGKELVDKALDLHNNKNKNDELQNSQGQQAGQGRQITQEEQGGAADGVHGSSFENVPRATFRTLDYGDFKGQKEDAEAKQQIESQIKQGNVPIGKTGETFHDFVDRIIDGFRNTLKNEANNTTIVTHSSVIKALKVWDEMGRPDKLSDKQREEFADKYLRQSTKEGEIETFKGENGDIHVIRHGETEDNKLSEFRADDTQLTEKGQKQASLAGAKLKELTGGDVPKIISSDLPRTVHTARLIQESLGKGTEVSNETHPQESAEALQGSYDRLAEQMKAEGKDPEADPEMQKLKENIDNLKSKSNASDVRKNPGQGSSSGQAPEGSQNASRENLQQQEGQETGNATPEQPAGQQKPQSVEDEDWPFVDEPGDDKITSTQNAVTEKKIEEYGLIPAMKAAKRAFGEVWETAQRNIRKGFDIEGLLDKLSKKPRAVTDVENAMILYYQATKESQLDAVLKDINEAASKGDDAGVAENRLTRIKLLSDLQKVYNVDRAIGTETARGLNARKMMADRKYSLVNMRMEKQAAQDGKPLTEEQAAEVEKKYNDIKQANDALQKRIDQLESEAKQPKEVKSKKSKEKYTQERKDIISRMRDDLLKAAKGGEGLTSSIPLAAQLKAIAPHIRDLAKSYIEQGIDTLAALTQKIKSDLKPIVPDLEDEHIHDLIAGEFNEPNGQQKAPTKYQDIKAEAKKAKYAITDPKVMELRADYERQKDSWNDDLKKLELAKRTKLEKMQDAFIKWERAFKLSGITTLAKLGMAGATRLATSPVEEGVGAVYSKVLPSIAKKATGEGSASLKAEAKAISSAFTQGMKDSYDIMRKSRRGQSDIEAVFGKKGELPPEAINFFGHLHSAIKAPVKRAAFERSLTKRIEANLKSGVDVTDPMVQSKIGLQAYKDAQRAIFMQDNFVSDSYRKFVNSLENSKNYPNAGKAAATFAQWMVPFVKVPTNIVGEVGTLSAGVPIGVGKIIYHSFKEGLSNISEEDADSIMRNLKKGSLGAAALMLGYSNPAMFGGYYRQGEKKGKNDPGFGGMKIGDTKIPVWLLESPIFQTMQLGATIRQVKDKKIKGKPEGLGEGVWQGAMGLAEHEPLVDQPTRILEAIKSPKERDYFLDELVKGTFEPAILQNSAEFVDKMQNGDVKRSPKNLVEHMEMGIPGWRENVKKKSTGQTQQLAN